MTDPLHPLMEVLTHVRAEAHAARVACVFDLDSTLFCVAPRTQFILRDLGSNPDFAARHAELARHLARVEVLPADYSVRKIVERFNLRPSLEAVTAVRDHWHQHFFGSDHLHRDLLYPSAAEYVNALAMAGGEIIYLTGRGELRMREGTERALSLNHFPLNDTNLLMKPSEVLTDEGFKAGVLRDLVTRFDHVWFFENEPVIINEVRALVPVVRVVFVKSAHSGKAVEPTDVRAILPDYRAGLISGENE